MPPKPKAKPESVSVDLEKVVKDLEAEHFILREQIAMKEKDIQFYNARSTKLLNSGQLLDFEAQDVQERSEKSLNHLDIQYKEMKAKLGGQADDLVHKVRDLLD